MKLYLLNNNPKKWEDVVGIARNQTGLDIQSITNSTNIMPSDFVMPTHSQIVPKCNLIGNRIYNRLQRMYLMESWGLRCIKWSPIDRFETIFKEWETDFIVFKSDHSAVGQYVNLIDKYEKLPIGANSNSDILMEFITDNPQVFKVYFCHDTIVSSYIWNLPSLNHPNFKQIISYAANKCELANLVKILPTDIEEMMNVIILKLKEKYMGFCSVDFMLWNGHWSISELNTSGVGSNIISHINKNWYKNFANGLGSLAKDLDKNKPSLEFIGKAYSSI
jgi:hypothetical protein